MSCVFVVTCVHAQQGVSPTAARCPGSRTHTGLPLLGGQVGGSRPVSQTSAEPITSVFNPRCTSAFVSLLFL